MQVRTGNLLRRAGIAVLIIGVVLVSLWSLQRRLVYFPWGEPPPAGEVLPAAQEITLTTDDGLELGAWYLEGGPTAMIVFPGNAGNRANRAPLAEALTVRGYSVLLVDYRGYGGNPGSPSERGLLADARAAADWIAARSHVDDVVYFGESLGAGVAVGLATEVPPAAMVLRSPFPSLVQVARVHYGPVPSWLVRDRFEVAEQLGRIAVPTLVVTGGADTIIPPRLSRAAHDAAAGPSRFVVVDGAGHNDRALLDGDELLDAIDSFLAEHGLH